MVCQDPLVRKQQSQMANPSRLVFESKLLNFMPRSRHQDAYSEAHSSYYYVHNNSTVVIITSRWQTNWFSETLAGNYHTHIGT